MVFGLHKKDVNMVANRINFDQRTFKVSQYARCYIGVQTPSLFVAQKRPAILRAEHEVNNNVGKRLRHESRALSGLIESAKYLGLRSLV